jgi:hypothetical protein
VAAAKWHFLAERAGETDSYLDDFVKSLTAEQRQAALTAAQRWPGN